MPKRAAAETPSKARKRGRRGKKDAADQSGRENDEAVLHQMRRKAIIEEGDEEEEWVREMERDEGGYFLEDIYIPPKITRTEHPFTGERLVIEKIVCENFKSYGGLKEMGPFHKSFSSIIGPNGNGKSNIIDAMLFVFGYRASKIRCKKIATLIHRSELLPEVRSCSVSVHFVKILDEGDKDGQDDDDYNIVSNSQIVVKRKALANSSSTYYLNNRVVKFQEIAKFLKSNGVDLTHNRFLILQGEVEQIAQMPAIGTHGNDGLLEFLEEVIGTKRYIRPLAQLEERIEKLDFERDEKLQRLDNAEKEKASLAEPVKKAKEYLRDQNIKIRYQNMFYQKSIYLSKKRIVEKEAAKTELEEKLKVLQVRLDEILVVNKARKKEVTEAEALFNSSEKEYLKIKKKFDVSDAEFIKLQQEIKRANETRHKLKKELEKLEGEIEKLKLVPESNERDINQLSKRKIQLDTDIQKEEESIKGDLENLNKKLEKALKEKEITDKKFSEAKAKRDELKANLDKLIKQLENNKQIENKEQKKLEELEADLAKLKEAITKKERDGRNSTGGAKQIGDMEKKIKELSKEEQKLIEQENNERRVFDKIRDELQTANDANDGNNQMDKVDQALLEAKADGVVPGLYGRLKNLAKIPEKYNIAATTSTGMLEYWVTDNDDTAGKCIQFLRERNLGVQNFLCLTRLQNLVRPANERFDAPGPSHRIFDLLEISDPVLRPAYYKAFRNTLVADNIEIATSVAYGGSRRFRVVSLKGEIVEATGSLVGGGRPITEGKFNSRKSSLTITKQQLAELRKRHDEARAKFQKVQEIRQRATQETRKLSEEIEDIKRKINNHTSDLAALKAQLPLKQANLETQQKKVKECALSPRDLKEREAAIQLAQKEFDKLQSPFDKAEEDATRINNNVQELQVTKKNEITKKLNKFKEQLKKVEEELNKKIVELKNCETNQKKTEKKMETVKKQIENMEDDMKKKLERKNIVEEQAKEIKEKEVELAAKVEETKTALQELKGRSHEFQKEENTLAKEKASLETQFSDANGDLQNTKQQLKAMGHTLKNLQVHKIPEEEVEPLQEYSDEEIKKFQLQELERKVAKHAELIKSRPTPNLNILEEYMEKVEILLQRIKELDEINIQRDKFREAYTTLDSQRSTEFMEGFALISSRLKEMFRMISMGGDAELEIVDMLDLFGCGINFSVRPARKTWKKISNLSGGEKTLSSLSLVFALHHFKPSPFYIMDEIDAALDFKNVSIIANYIKERTRFTQFIIISLRSNMFELADSLLGVYKVDNMSYCIHFGVRKIINELRRKYNKPAAIISGKINVEQIARSIQAIQSRLSGFKNKDTHNNSEMPGTSQAIREELERFKQRAQKNVANFPDVNLSKIVDIEEEEEEEAYHTADDTLPEEDEMVSTPQEQISETPSAAVAQNESSKASGLFEDDNSPNVPISKALKKAERPIAASTPFVGKRPSSYDTPPELKKNTDNVESDELEDMISPISIPTAAAPRRSVLPSSTIEPQTDSDNSDEMIGPSQ